MSRKKMTPIEESLYQSWPESAKKLLDLTLRYGNYESIPDESIKEIQLLSLLELKSRHKKVEAQESEPNDSKPVQFAASPLPSSLKSEDPLLKNRSPEGNPQLDYELLWKLYPKRNNYEGYQDGMALLKQMVLTQEQYQAVFNGIRGYAKHIKTTKVEPKYILKFDNFLRRVGEFIAKPDLRPKKKVKVKRPWNKPLRPSYPWELDVKLALTSKEKEAIIEDLKQKHGYYDENSNWFYEIEIEE